MTIGQILRRIYFITWIRIPTKFVICFAGVKIVWDYSQYLTKWRRRNTQPRFCQYDTQSPANPPLVQPYPYYDNYEQMQDLKHFYMACNRGFKLFAGQIDKAFVYTDHPYRENINSIDQLLVRAKEYSCSQNLKFHTINEYIKQQQSIPQSVYKQIREIHQQQMEVNSPIIPKL